MDTAWIWALPVGAFSIGLTLFAFGKWESWRFDRKHPHLSRTGMAALQSRSDALVSHLARKAASNRLPTPIAFSRNEEMQLDAVRRQAVSEDLDRSLGKLGERVADDLNRKRIAKERLS